MNMLWICLIYWIFERTEHLSTLISISTLKVENPYGSLTQLKGEGESELQLTKTVVNFEAQQTISAEKDVRINESTNNCAVIINGNGNCHNNNNIRSNTIERSAPRVTIAEPSLNTFRSGSNNGAEVRRRENTDGLANHHFSQVVDVPPHHRSCSNSRYDINKDTFELSEIPINNCGIPGSHQRPPPPQYRRSDYIVSSQRDFDETRRIMTLDRRRMGGPNHEDRIRSYHPGNP